MIHRLSALLEDAGVELSAEELRDVLWLAVTTAPAGTAAGAGRGTGPAGGEAGEAGEPGTADGAQPRGGGPTALWDAREDEDHDEPGTGVPAGLYAPGGRGAATGTRPARAVGVHGVRALPAARGLARSLRPLRRSVASRSAFTLDETATADWIAETGLPDAVLRPRRERWLSVALVVDDGPSMALWQQLAGETRALLERQGAFQRVRTYGLDSGSADAPVLRARPYAPTAPRRTPRHLADSSGRTVMLVLSDGVGPGWRSGAIPRMLRAWARHSPVAVIQPLPARMWPERGMPTRRLLVTADREGAPGRALSVRHPVLPPGLVSYEGTPIPVLEAEEGRFAAWAALVGTGRADDAELPVMLLTGDQEPAEEPEPAADQGPAADREPAAEPAPAAGPAPEERLSRFRGAASPESQRLARSLAAIHPLTLPVMRLVHQAGGAERREAGESFHPAQLAEVFLGGLLRGHGGATGTGTGSGAGGGDTRSPESAEYEFHPGVADLLLDGVSTPDALETAARVTEFLLRRQSGGPEFRARLTDGGDATVAAEARPFAAASPELLQRLGLLDTDQDRTPERADDQQGADGQPEETPPPGAALRRSYASEQVQPPLMALVRRLDAEEVLPVPVREAVDRLLSGAEVRDGSSGWTGVQQVARLAGELVSAGWQEYADLLRDEILVQLARLSTGDDLESRSLRGHLALALNRLSLHDEAEAHLREIIELSARAHGETHDYTLNARRFLVGLLDGAGRPGAAEKEAAVLIELLGRRPDKERDEILDMRQSRGRLLIGLTRFEEAEAEFRAVALERRDLLGPTHFSTLYSRIWLSGTLRRRGHYEGAEAEVRSALEEAQSALPKSNAGVLGVLIELGHLLKDRERHEEAEEVWRDVVAREHRAHGPGDWRTLSARHEFIGSLRAQRRWEEAETEVLALLPVLVETRGERHVDYFRLLMVRAEILSDQKRYEEAEAVQRALLRDQLRLLGEEHPSTLATVHSLGITLHDAGRYDEALTEFTRALRGRERTLGPDARPTLLSQYWRARTLKGLDRLAEAEGEYRATVAAETRIQGADHPSTLTTRWWLALLVRDLKRYDEAERDLRILAETSTRVQGAEAGATLGIRQSLGNALNKAGHFAEGEKELRSLLAQRLRVQGPEHVNTLWTRQKLGNSLRGLGRPEEAEAQWTEVLEVALRVRGEEHECTKSTRKLLAELRAERGTDEDDRPRRRISPDPPDPPDPSDPTDPPDPVPARRPTPPPHLP
ncbi:SAV_2336 N-terminal domain-related protein [Streptomyces sp. NPDC087851]|uniref:SAV_2336 N-terminal domain-related protein n=1 Tax=Streptomyces sp. NPDC087851 TaxID=3365810 RepID=UPI0037F2B80A